MASSSPTAPGLAGEAVQNEELNDFGYDTATVSAMSPRILGVQDNDAAPVWMLPGASDEEGALAACELITISVMITVQSEPALIGRWPHASAGFY